MDSRLENYNIAADTRSRGDRNAPETVEVWDPQRECEVELEIPTTWSVCPTCNGEGKHVNPAIDAGGLTAEDFHDDPDFAESYMGGRYDVTCNGCKGRTTVRVADWGAMCDADRRLYEEHLKAEADAHAEHLAELRMGC